MRYLDLWLQRARIKKVQDRIGSPNKVVLDIGCHKGELALALREKSVDCYGIDPVAISSEPSSLKPDRIATGYFPADLPSAWSDVVFDHVVALAVIEHVPKDVLVEFMAAVARRLRSGGTFIVTVPSPRTDYVLDVLQRLRLIDGMDLEAHDGLTIDEVLNGAKEAGLQLDLHKSFQFGFNNLIQWSKV